MWCIKDGVFTKHQTEELEKIAAARISVLHKGEEENRYFDDLEIEFYLELVEKYVKKVNRLVQSYKEAWSHDIKTHTASLEISPFTVSTSSHEKLRDLTLVFEVPNSPPSVP